MSDGIEEFRVKIPSRLIKAFNSEVPIILKYHPAGLWPVDPGFLMSGQFKELFSDREFQEQYEVVIMPRTVMK